ncbi:hypothetical protein Tcan_00148 [Toxocara canis]|uniref:Uncharacterized protein n=1 Tax=Toxocara canis TaxID=6265 RepID=A0A0B2V0K7_TOXCA|nr:hypothetical protein Tcan_00148 [Toxocara canis]
MVTLLSMWWTSADIIPCDGRQQPFTPPALLLTDTFFNRLTPTMSTKAKTYQATGRSFRMKCLQREINTVVHHPKKNQYKSSDRTPPVPNKGQWSSEGKTF